MIRQLLVATPARAGTPTGMLRQAEAVYKNVTAGVNARRALWLNDYPPASGKYTTNAWARNQLVELYLRPEDSHILWLDVDVVEAPAGLARDLAKVSERDIVAPLVLFESRPGYAGRFYDVGGFTQDGRWANQWPPYFAGGKLCEMDSVGTCYLMPAEIFRRLPAPWYEPAGDDVEHVSMMAKARALGYRVLASREIRVYHAYLPDHGESLH